MKELLIRAIILDNGQLAITTKISNELNPLEAIGILNVAIDEQKKKMKQMHNEGYEVQ